MVIFRKIWLAVFTTVLRFSFLPCYRGVVALDTCKHIDQPFFSFSCLLDRGYSIQFQKFASLVSSVFFLLHNFHLKYCSPLELITISCHTVTLRENCPNTKLFLVRIQENTDQKDSVFGHFSRSVNLFGWYVLNVLNCKRYEKFICIIMVPFPSVSSVKFLLTRLLGSYKIKWEKEK